MNKWNRRIINLKKRWKSDGPVAAIRYYFLIPIRSLMSSKAITKLIKMLPVGRILTFECENDMQDNARALYEYLYENKYHKRYTMVWIVKDIAYCKNHYSRKKVKFINRNNTNIQDKLRFSYYISRSKYFFFTHPYWLKEWKKNQTVIHLCHGAPPLKGRDITNKGSLGHTFDYILAPSKHVVPWECDFWGCTEEKAILLGAPRNDWLFKGTYETSLKCFVKKQHQEKVILAMPTFRQTKGWSDSTSIDRYCLNVIKTPEQMKQLNQICAQHKIHILIKIHPLQNLEVIERNNYSHIHYLSNQELYEKDISVDELMGCCDALITDFSSVYIEYLLLNRPVAFFVNKEQDYKRGYIMNNPEYYMPGEKISDMNQLVEFILHVKNGQDEYESERKRVNDLINTYQDCHNCKRLVEYLSL